MLIDVDEMPSLIGSVAEIHRLKQKIAELVLKQVIEMKSIIRLNSLPFLLDFSRTEYNIIA